ncbi:hypothetical protein OG524_34600 [Streptomyces sp. NBC_01520]|uniref:hypothetical protein n=1 Tax=Streptomyces sp. NBC_01520 TaxID=2903892 RepID=UPI0038701371
MTGEKDVTDGRRHVFLDLAETGSGWVFVVVAAPTGVAYRTRAEEPAASRTSRRVIRFPCTAPVWTTA